MTITPAGANGEHAGDDIWCCGESLGDDLCPFNHRKVSRNLPVQWYQFGVRVAWHFGRQDGTYYHPPSADCRASRARSTACWSHLNGVNQVLVLFLGRMLLALDVSCTDAELMMRPMSWTQGRARRDVGDKCRCRRCCSP